MRFPQRLVRTELVALLALTLVAGAMAGYSAFQASVAVSSALTPLASAEVTFVGTFLFGFIPVSLFGAPAYAWLSHRGRVTWWALLVLAAGPGVLAAFVDSEIAVLSLICGFAVAGITHLACRRWVSPNNSFNPMPLRGTG